MTLLLDDLTINISQIDQNDLIDSWRWLIKDFRQILLISKMGDMFLSANNELIYWLATDDGNLQKISDTQAEFEQLLMDDDNIDNWFLPSLVAELIDAGKLLGEKQVYSFKMLPIIGGDYTADNIEPTDVSIHFTLTGVIHEKIKDLPNGTKVQIKLFD